MLIDIREGVDRHEQEREPKGLVHPQQHGVLEINTQKQFVGHIEQGRRKRDEAEGDHLNIGPIRGCGRESFEAVRRLL